MHRSNPLRTLAVVAVLSAVIGASSAWAAQRFTDVPEASPFAQPIDELADAGIASGYPDGSYGPTRPITRQTAAALLGRGLGRISDEHRSALMSAGTGYRLAPVDFSSPVPAGAGVGQVLVLASVRLTPEGPQGCPCIVAVGIADDQGQLVAGEQVVLDGSSTESITRSVAAPLPAGADREYVVTATIVNGTALVFGSADVSVLYVPFSEDPGSG